jgi:hypothetical protein
MPNRRPAPRPVRRGFFVPEEVWETAFRELDVAARDTISTAPVGRRISLIG